MSNDEVSYRKGGDIGYVPSQFNAPEGFQVAYQTEEGAAWKYANCPVKDGRIPGAKLVTTTANKDHGENEPVEQIGELCIDIDLRFKINEACQSAVGIVDFAMSLGVHQDDIHLWFSGSKGVHIRIPAKCFDGALYDYRFNLAVALKAFAKHLDDKVKELGLAESGLDFQMYKKWQMWRVAGVQRKNGLYKIPVDLQEVKALAGMGIDAAETTYREMCATPRDESWRQPESCEALSKLARQIFQAAVEEDSQKKAKLAARYVGEQCQGAGKRFVGLHRINTGLEAALFVGPTGKRAMGDGYDDWGLVASALHREGHVYDCMAEAEAAFIEYSKATPGFKSEQAARQRFHGYDESQAKAHYTIASLVAKAKALGPFLSSSPAGKADYNHEPRAVQVLTDWLGLNDQAQQRSKLREPVFPAAVRACQIEGWNGLVGQVYDRAKTLGAKQELIRAVKELDAELGTAGDEETTAEKLNKLSAQKFVFALDQWNEPVALIAGKCFALSDAGGFLKAAAVAWASDPDTAEKPFPARAMADLLPTFVAKAEISGKRVVFEERWVRTEQCTYIDFHWCIVEVSRQGWKVVESLPPDMQFRRTPWCLPMPGLTMRSGPVALGSALLRELEKFTLIMNLPAKSVPVLAACLTFVIKHKTGSPVVVLSGGPGTAKTTTATTSMLFLSPSAKVADSMPSSYSDLVAILGQRMVTLLDNVSNISNQQSDLLCRLTTGSPNECESKRKLYTDSDLVSVRAGRVVWTTGIGSFVERGDLASRAVCLHLMPLTGPVETLDELGARVNQYAPGLMTALLDLAVGGWAVVEQFGPGHPIRSKITRMAGFDLWLAACFEVLGLGWEAGVAALSEDREQEAVQALEGHKWLGGLAKLRGEFVGTIDELSNQLLEDLGYSSRLKPHGWPTGKQLFAEVMRQQTSLIRAGFIVEQLPQGAKKSARKWRIVAP